MAGRQVHVQPCVLERDHLICVLQPIELGRPGGPSQIPSIPPGAGTRTFWSPQLSMGLHGSHDDGILEPLLRWEVLSSLLNQGPLPGPPAIQGSG